MTSFFDFFLFGISWGLSFSCVATCGITLTPFLAASKNNLNSALKSAFYFQSGRLLSYCLQGVLAALLGRQLKNILTPHFILIKTFLSLSLFFLALILLLNTFNFLPKIKLLEKKINPHCNFINTKEHKSSWLVGFLVGSYLCLPFTLVLLNIALNSKNILNGLFSALFYGIGVALSSTIILAPAAAITRFISSKFFPGIQTNTFFRLLNILFLLYVAVRILFSPVIIASKL